MVSTGLAIFPLLLLFAGSSLPLGLPPLPEDPVISRAAPEECLVYVSWAGTAAPDAKSTNRTEQLLAEPEVQRLFSAIDSAVSAGIKKKTHDAENTRDVYPLVKTLLTRPAAIFVSKVAIGPQGPPNIQGGAIFNLADETAAVSESLDRLEKLLPPGAAEKVEVAGMSCHQIKMGPIPTVTWGVREKYLIVGIGEGVVEGISKRAKAESPAWLATIRTQLPVDRFSTLTYFNVKQIVFQFVPLGGPKAAQVLNAAGLSNVSYLASLTGLDDKGTVARTLVAIDGQPQGVFRLAAAKPLTAADLSPIPRDATIASAGRFDANTSLDLLLAQIAKIDPDASKGVTSRLGEMEKELGVNLQEDLLKPLGDVWCVYNSPGEGGLLVTGLTGVVHVKDHDRLETTLNKLIALYRDSLEPSAAEEEKADPGMQGNMSRRSAPRIRRSGFAGQVVYHLEMRNDDFPLAPSWCLTKKELIVSTFPANIKSYLSRSKGFQSLATVPDVAGALQGGAAALSYCNTRKVAEFAYPLLCIGGRFISSKLSQEGIPLDASLVPSAAAIFPHLQPSIGVVRQTSAGIEFESHGLLAGIGGAPLLPAAMIGFFTVRAEAMPPATRPRAIDQPAPTR